jgi:hypothetical protein
VAKNIKNAMELKTQQRFTKLPESRLHKKHLIGAFCFIQLVEVMGIEPIPAR